jgi:hypothetical protein
MNNFCIDLTLPVLPLREGVSVEKYTTVPHSKINQLDINPNLVSLLDSIGLEINIAESFYRQANSSAQIHRDVKHTTDAAKINWVYNGTGSTMNWYNIINNIVYESTTSVGVAYQYYNPADLELIHSQKVGFPSLLQVAVPHNITMTNETRLCLSMVLRYKGTDSFPTFNQCKALLENYVNTY